MGVGGIVAHVPLEQQIGRRSQRHRRARVPVADLLHGIHGEHACRVDGSAVQIGPFKSHGWSFQTLSTRAFLGFATQPMGLGALKVGRRRRLPVHRSTSAGGAGSQRAMGCGEAAK